MGLKCYFDGSGQKDRLTLAVVAGDEDAWFGLEADWLAVLQKVEAPYMHMTDAMSLRGPFRGWDEDKRDWLVNALLQLVLIHQQRAPLAVFTCTVDLLAHAELSAIRWLPPPARICARALFSNVFEWYCRFPDPVLGVVEMHFDRNESFMAHLEADWKCDEFRAAYPAWDLIRTIAPAAMDQTPGIQVADLFAWARQRVDRQTADKFFAIASLALKAPGGTHYIVDREKLLSCPPYLIR